MLFIQLGFWQIDRSYEKEILIEEDTIRRASPGVALNDLPKELSKLDGQPIKLIGHFIEDKAVLLDNVVFEGRVGYEVMVPFYDESSSKTVLVNRGFVQMGRTRADKPVVPPLMEGEQMIEGNVYVTKRVNEKIETLNFEPKALRIVQSKDPLVLENLLGSNAFVHLVRLSDQNPNSLPRYWPIVTMLPEKHFGYAMTWFSMAIAIAIAFSVFTYQTNRELTE